MKLKLPKKPVNGFALTFWTTDYDRIKEVTWRYFIDEPCSNVVPGFEPGHGVPYRDEWYTGGGRCPGWTRGISHLQESTHCHATRSAAVKFRIAAVKTEVEHAKKQLAKYETELCELLSETTMPRKT